MAKKRCPEKESYWREVVRRHTESGLSAKRFCEESGIGLASFYSWRRQLIRRDHETFESRNDNVPVLPADCRSPFIPISLVNSASKLEVVHPLGCRVRVHGQVDTESLRSVLQVLDERGDQ